MSEKKEVENKGGRGIAGFLKSKVTGIMLSTVQLIMTVVMFSLLLYLNVLPIKYYLPAALIFLLMAGYTYMTVTSDRFRTLGKIIAVIITALCCVGTYYIGHLNRMVDNVSGAGEKTDIINVYVMKDDGAQSIEDTKDYTFGIIKEQNRENTDKVISRINGKVGKEIALEECDGWMEMVKSLYDGEVNAIIMNSAYENIIAETEGYENFKEDTRIIQENAVTTPIDVDTDKDVANNTFIFYISGIDVYGKISTTSRSDVNIMAVVNPDTRQVLLVNTPRDYFVPLSLAGNPKDKLTHAGIYGIDVSMGTIGMLYGVNIDYYFRVNFTGFKQVIDKLGGVNVYSEYAFKNFKKGYNYLDGTQALVFARERYSFPQGDNQRGKNQMEVIKAVIDKMSTSALLNDFSGLMSGLEGSFETSMTSAQISSLVRDQLNDGGSWNVKSYAVTGTGITGACYSMPTVHTNYLMQPNYDTVERAKQLIKMVQEGKTITDEDVK